MTKKHRVIFGCLFFALMFASLWGSFYADWLEKTKHSLRGWEAMNSEGKSVIFRVNRGGPKSELMVGDEIVSLESPQKSAFRLEDQDKCYVLPNTIYNLVIRRGGETKEFTLKTIPFPLYDWFLDWFTNLTRLLFVLTGLTIFLLRSGDQQARLLALMLGTFVGLFRLVPYGSSGWLLIASDAAYAIGLAFLPFFFHFFLIFPERGSWLGRFPRLEILLYLPFLLTLLPIGALQFIQKHASLGWLIKHFPSIQQLGLSNRITVPGYLFAGLVALSWNYRAANASSRRKLRVVVAGCGLAFVNLLLLILAGYLGFSRTLPQLYDWAQYVLLISLPLVPISFAYAIIRHQVIPVSLIIRRGIRYLLVSRGSVLVEMIAVSVVLFLMMDKLFSWWNPASGRIVGTVSAVVAIVWWVGFERLHRKWIAPAIDRRFFRQSYDSHQIIADLVESLRTTTSLPHLMEMAATKIRTALQTESASVLLRDKSTGDYVSDYACQYSMSEGRVIASHQRLTISQKVVVEMRLEERGVPVEFDYQKNGSHAVDKNIVQMMSSKLLMPLKAKEGMPGIIWLGPRLGDLPFSREDKRLLMSVAGPTTFAIENARLVERMIEEARQREEIEAENEARAKELEEARQLQLSMLPKTVPQLPHLEIAAYMKTATEVGGDYYDFHLADDGTLTVAIGDATGHGLKAGTVVTAMKCLFRTYAQEPDPALILMNSSRVLKEMNLRALYMALTLIKIKDRCVKVASAGMPPMLIYRADEVRIEEVTIKTVPLGSLSQYTYQEREVILHDGDMIVLMSDGFPERFNRAGEILDYQRATDALRSIAGRQPREVIEHFVEVGDLWANGRPQNDDVTFVVIQLK